MSFKSKSVSFLGLCCNFNLIIVPNIIFLTKFFNAESKTYSFADAKSNLKTLWSLSGAQTGKLFNQLKNLAAYPVSNISSWDKSLDINNDKNILKSQVKSASSEESWKINGKPCMNSFISFFENFLNLFDET